jgi:nitric oxide reductase NorE protein
MQSIKKENYPPGDLVIWILIYAELLVFGALFISFAYVRSNNVELFNQSQLLVNTTAGAINTLVLITSSYFVVRAVNAIKNNDQKKCGFWLMATLLLACVFIVIKLIEFDDKFSAGINLSTNMFWSFYLSMTVFHFMHVIVGMIIIGAVWLKNKKGGYSAQDHMGVETGASYWHMVDLVWIILFPLVYVMR